MFVEGRPKAAPALRGRRAAFIVREGAGEVGKQV